LVFSSAASAAFFRKNNRLLDHTDKEVDALVYELYGLNEEETSIVEGGP
jgi:hypothetical protein